MSFALVKILPVTFATTGIWASHTWILSNSSFKRRAANPVLWEDCVAEMVNFGVTRFVEVGPGKVLTGFTKKINKDMELANVEDIASLEKTLEFLKGVR